MEVTKWLNIGGRVNREVHARFWERPGGEIPPGDSPPSDHRQRHPERPHLWVEPTNSGRKRKSPLESLLSGVDRTYLGHGWNFAS